MSELRRATMKGRDSPFERPMTRFHAFFIAWATAFGPASFSQGQVTRPLPNQPPENVIHVNVNLVQMDAVVTDSHGNPIDNLKPEDFEILQDRSERRRGEEER